jgi:hypothetical protein
MKDDDRRDDAFDALLRDAVHSYNSPPERTDADATWAAIERAMDEAPRPLAVLRDDARRDRPGMRVARHPWMRMAAVLLLGVAVGRVTAGRDAASRSGAPNDTTTSAPLATATARLPLVPAAVDAATGEYLARTEALLAGLPAELRERGERGERGEREGNVAFVSQADALLLQTRLLLDSPAAADPALRALLDDLEIVLAQVVRLDAGRDPMKVDFLHEAMEQRDVLPRLREAVVDRSAD